MTDMYGQEPHEHESGHDEVLTPEQEEVHEAPSDYEFADDPEHGAAAAAEEHADDGAMQADAADALPRRSALLPVMAAIGGVVLLAGVAWWQFGGSSSPPPPQTTTHQIVSAPAVSETPQVSTVAPKTASAYSSNLPIVPAPVVPAPVQAAPAPTPIPGIIVAKPAAPSQDERIAAINARLDTLQKMLEQTTQQLSQVTNMAAAQAGPDRATGERLDRLEQQIAQLHNASVAPAHAAAVRPAASVTEPSAEPARRHVARIAHKARTKTKPSVVILPREVEPPAITWVLRAASPGQAWVAPSATSRDLRQVRVGDTLPGIGRITAIQQQGPNWVVQGTAGAVQ